MAICLIRIQFFNIFASKNLSLEGSFRRSRRRRQPLRDAVVGRVGFRPPGRRQNSFASRCKRRRRLGQRIDPGQVGLLHRQARHWRNDESSGN